MHSTDTGTYTWILYTGTGTCVWTTGYETITDHHIFLL